MEAHEAILTTKKGEAMDALVHVAEVISDSGKKMGSVVMLDNVTHHKKVQEELASAQIMLQTIFDNSRLAIFTLDLEKEEIMQANDTFFSWVGYTRKDVLGKPILKLPFLPKSSLKILKDVLSERYAGLGVEAYTLRLVNKTGKITAVKVENVGIRDSHGKVLFDLVLMEDISDKLLLESDLRNKIEELQKFKDFAINRELKMIELKKRIELDSIKLEAKKSKKPKRSKKR